MKKEFLSVVLIAVIGFAVYSNSLQGEFIWDDARLVRDNSFIRSFSHLPKVFTTNIRAGAARRGSTFRPLQTFSYMADYYFWKSDVFGFHLTNVILHILAAVCLYFFALLLFKDKLFSLLASLLFVVHPVHSEAVAYISGRADPLAAIFIFLSFIFYIKVVDKEKPWLYLFMSLSYIAALFSREASLIFPLAALFYHYAFKKRVKLKSFGLLLGLALAYMILRATLLKSLLPDDLPYSGTRFLTRFPGTFLAITRYLRLLVLPLGLHMEYGDSLFSWILPQVLLGVLVVLLAGRYLMARSGKSTLIVFSVGWFFIMLIPQANLYPINSYMAEHWLYLPSIGFFFILAKIFTHCLSRRRLELLAIIAFVALFGFYSFLTRRQNTYWLKPLPFYQRTLEYAPESYRVHNNLGNLYRARAEYPEAVDSYEKALAIDVYQPDVYYNLANTYRDMGKTDQAVLAYKKVIILDPDYAYAYNNLATIYESEGKAQEAIAYYTKAVEIYPAYAEAFYNLGNAYLNLGDDKKASGFYQRVIEIAPLVVRPYNNLAIIYSKAGRKQEAISLLGRAIALKPDHPEFYNNLANIYKEQGDNRQAIYFYKKAIDLKSDYTAAHNNLIVTYYDAKEYDLAIKHLDQVLSLGYNVKPALVDMLEPCR